MWNVCHTYSWLWKHTSLLVGVYLDVKGYSCSFRWKFFCDYWNRFTLLVQFYSFQAWVSMKWLFEVRIGIMVWSYWEQKWKMKFMDPSDTKCCVNIAESMVLTNYSLRGIFRFGNLCLQLKFSSYVNINLKFPYSKLGYTIWFSGWPIIIITCRILQWWAPVHLWMSPGVPS